MLCARGFRPYLFGDLRHRQFIADHRHYGLIPLLGHAQLPSSRECQGSAEITVNNQPKHRQASPEDKMSSINRGHTLTWWGGRGSNPRPTDYRPMRLDSSSCSLSSVAPECDCLPMSLASTGQFRSFPSHRRRINDNSFEVSSRFGSSSASRPAWPSIVGTDRSAPTPLT
jgi:hypothetical protein